MEAVETLSVSTDTPTGKLLSNIIDGMRSTFYRYNIRRGLESWDDLDHLLELHDAIFMAINYTYPIANRHQNYYYNCISRIITDRLAIPDTRKVIDRITIIREIIDTKLVSSLPELINTTMILATRKPSWMEYDFTLWADEYRSIHTNFAQLFTRPANVNRSLYQTTCIRLLKFIDNHYKEFDNYDLYLEFVDNCITFTSFIMYLMQVSSICDLYNTSDHGVQFKVVSEMAHKTLVSIIGIKLMG